MGEKLKCEPKPCKVPSDNELNKQERQMIRGDCKDELQHDGECTIKCNDGYERGGKTTCNAGTLALATCKPSSCEMKQIEHGDHDECPSAGDELAHERKCKPKCHSEFYADPKETVCKLGQLLETKCKRKLKCELIPQKTCKQDHGYWTVQSMNYEQCEMFCNKKQDLIGDTSKQIKGCELN